MIRSVTIKDKRTGQVIIRIHQVRGKWEIVGTKTAMDVAEFDIRDEKMRKMHFGEAVKVKP